MATYFVNASGGNNPPYADENDGALNFATLLANVTLVNTDIIEVVDDGVIDDTGATILIPSLQGGYTIRSWSGNTNNPRVNVINDNVGVSITNVAPITHNNHKIQDIDFVKLGPNASKDFIAPTAGSGFSLMEISGCTMYVQNTSGMVADVVALNMSGAGVTSSDILNNTIYNVTSGLVFSTGSNNDINNNNIYDFTTYGISYTSNFDNQNFFKNEIYNGTYGIYSTSTTIAFHVKNNIIRDMSQDGILFSGNCGTQPHSVCNNSVRNCTNYGISVGGGSGMQDSHILNNVVHGGNGCAVGIRTFAQASTFSDSNCAYGCTANLQLGGTSGPNNITVDPLFVSSTDLKLKVHSPCLDAGRGSNSYAVVPSDDIRGQSRPVVLPNVTNVDNGTDIGAYEMLASEVQQVPFYVNPSGSGVAPFDSSNTGAVNFGTLLSSITLFDDDVIYAVQDGGVIDDSTNTVSSIDKNISILSDVSGVGKASILVNNDSALINFVDGATSPVVRDLSMAKPGPDATSNFIDFARYNLDSLSITGNEFSITNTSNADARGVFFLNNTITDGTVSGNSFDDLTDGVYSLGPSGGGAVVGAHSHSMNTRMTGIYVGGGA